MCRAEEAGRFAVTVGIAGQSREAFQDVGDEQVRLDFGGARERLVGVTLGLSGSPCAIATRARVVSASDRNGPSCRYGVVGPAAGRDEIPARQRGLGIEGACSRRRLWRCTQVLARPPWSRLPPRGIAGGQGRNANAQ